MNIQETIKHLQSSIKIRSTELARIDKKRINWKASAQLSTKYNDDYAVYCWREHHWYKEKAINLANQQKIEKSLYKLMLTISKASPNGNISLFEIRGL